MLLSHHLDRFQLDPSGLKQNVNEKEQRLLDRYQQPASGDCNRATDSEPIRGAATPADQYEEKPAPRHEPDPPPAAPALDNYASATDSEGQGGEELDRIVAEVQKITDLVFTDSLPAEHNG
jgi:hypothetical protein